MSELKIDTQPKLFSLNIYTKKKSLAAHEGGMRTIFIGKGLEFDRYRTFQAGDDASAIDWKASVKAKNTLVKVYEEERTIDLFFLFDVSNTMCFTSSDKLKIEYGAELILSIAYAALQSDDDVGIAMFADSVKHVVKPGFGPKQFFLLKNMLVDSNNYGGKFNLAAGIQYANTILKPNDILIIVSDFIGFQEKWEPFIHSSSAKYDLIVILINDPRDLKLLPHDNTYLLQDPFTGDDLAVSPKKFKELYERETKRHMAYITELMSTSGADFLHLTTDQDFVMPVREFFRRRGGR